MERCGHTRTSRTSIARQTGMTSVQERSTFSRIGVYSRAIKKSTNFYHSRQHTRIRGRPMSTTHINTPTSVLKLGHASGDITPPVGIYHRMWGAAQHDAATGVHRPIQADVILLEPIDASASDRVLRLQLDLVNLTTEQMDRLAANTGEAADINPERVLITFSHSHASGFYAPNRRSLPGGDLIDPYLDDLNRTAARLAGEALENLSESTITYAFARCDMARNRDYRDEQVGIYATGYNPDRTGDDTLLIGRVTGSDEEIRLIIVSYGCHPTTLAWDNTLISPDYIGALREVIETDTNAPCCFFQAPSGDLGPRDGFVGEGDGTRVLRY